MNKNRLTLSGLSSHIILYNLSSNLKRTACFLLAVILLLLAISLPASAALEGILAKDSTGSYHYYDYHELIDSRINIYLGEPDGLYEDYQDTWPVALHDSINGFVDIDYVFNEYVCLLLQGQRVSIDEITERPDVKKAETPEKYYLVTVEAGKLVRKEIKLNPEGGADDYDKPGKDDQDEDQEPDEDNITELGETLIISSPTVTLTQAQNWAKSKNAHQRFVDIAPLYWEYGRKTGIRPEVLYAQAAYESGYGRFNGLVPASFNNWAGIKTGSSNGESTEDYEQFATPGEGVRGHFNHISAYVGLDPVGKPHDRYYSVKSMPWAGTVEYIEELSGKWAHSPAYHETIVRMIGEMK